MNFLRVCVVISGGMALALMARAGLVDGAQNSSPGAQAQQHAASMEHHHSCIEEERASIERGEGFGMALAADNAGYPGPRHVLDLADKLKLTAEQRSAMEKVYAAMHEKAVARGKELLQSEARLEQMFRDGRPEADLREQSFRVDSIHAELRWVHLAAHLAAQKILTADQIALYTRMRQDRM